jgi:hypothetical protein
LLALADRQDNFDPWHWPLSEGPYDPLLLKIS